MNSTCPLLCFAVKEEAAWFSAATTSLPAEVLITGIGRKKAAEAVEKRLSNRPLPPLVVSGGFAGGLNPRWTEGEVLFDAGNSRQLAMLLTRAGAHAGNFFSTDRVISRANEKRGLWEKTKLDAVEMESSVIQAICQEQGVPCLTVRVISDNSARDLPLDFNRFFDSELRFRYTKLGAYLLAHPGKLAELLRFQKELRTAAEKLGTVLARFLTGLE